MVITSTRVHDNGVSTVGVIQADDLVLYTLEDPYRKYKIWGRTRIPAGIYEIKLRNDGAMNDLYTKKFPFHKGMLELQNVPNFKYIYFHIGNKATDSAGCILVGSGILNNDFITASTIAYIRLYSKLIKVLDRGEKLYIEIIDNELQ